MRGHAHRLHFSVGVVAAILVTAWLAVAAPPGPVPDPGHSGAQIAGGSITGDKLADNLALTGNASINSPTLAVSGDTVGIGTASPQAKVHIFEDGTGTSTPTLFVNDLTNVPTSNKASLLVRTNTDNTGFFVARFQSDNDAREVMAIMADGNVGIGTTLPNATLHVAGNANITGNLSVGSGTVTISGSGITFPDGSFQTHAAGPNSCLIVSAGATSVVLAGCPPGLKIMGGGASCPASTPIIENCPATGAGFCALSPGGPPIIATHWKAVCLGSAFASAFAICCPG